MPDDPLAVALDELYGADPDAFLARRTELTKQARTAGDATAAKRIGALRKPTRSAYAINRLARTDPASLTTGTFSVHAKATSPIPVAAGDQIFSEYDLDRAVTAARLDRWEWTRP